jgi:N-acetylglutamate synthase-like GNAT family acetyltransferase
MDHSLTLRRARPSDLKAVDHLLRRSYPRLLKPDYPPSVMVLALPIIARARPELLASGRYFVVQAEDGVILGAGGWSMGAPQAAGATDWAEQTGMGHVRHVAVDPERVRGGVGRAIMSEVIVDALRHGVRWLDCLSTRTAVPFYEAMGFRVLHEVEVGLAPGIAFPAIRMMRQIAP